MSVTELLSWLMFVASGIGPYSVQSVHFIHMAREKLSCAINRYSFEVERHYGIVEKRLGPQHYMVAVLTLGFSIYALPRSRW